MENFAKFVIIRPGQAQMYDSGRHVMAINLDHVVSVKPINISTNEGMIRGYWLRLTNGKKYKAAEIPAQLSDLVKDDGENFIVDDEDEEDAQQLMN